MARYHIVHSQLFHSLVELFKFKVSVTVYAGVRGLTLFVGGYKPGYDLFFKFIRKVKYIEGHTQFYGNGAGILHILKGTATLSQRLIPTVEPHICTYTLVTRILHKKGGYRAVHTAAHGYYSLFNIFFHIFFLLVFRVSL